MRGLNILRIKEVSSCGVEAAVTIDGFRAIG
jgi:hypothetical protein